MHTLVQPAPDLLHCAQPQQIPSVPCSVQMRRTAQLEHRPPARRLFQQRVLQLYVATADTQLVAVVQRKHQLRSNGTAHTKNDCVQLGPVMAHSLSTQDTVTGNQCEAVPWRKNLPSVHYRLDLCDGQHRAARVPTQW